MFDATRRSHSIKLGNRLNNGSLVAFFQLRIDRKGQNFRASRLSHRKLSRPVAETGESRLKVERNRIVNFGRDSVFAQKLPQSIALLASNDVLIVNVGTPCRNGRKGDLIPQTGLSKQGVVAPRRFLPPPGPFGKMAKFYPQHCRLQAIEAAIGSQHFIVIALAASMNSNQAKAVCKLRVLRSDEPSIARSSQVFRREEAETSSGSEASHRASLIASADGLGRVLNDRQLMAACYFQHRIEL